MGTRVIFKYSDFSTNAISQEAPMVQENFGTSQSLWSYATTNATGGYFGFIAQKDYVVTGMIIYTAEASNEASVGVFNHGDSYSDIKQKQDLTLKSGLQTVVFDTPITVYSGQCIAVKRANVYYCEPTTCEGDYPTNSYDGVFMTAPYRCFRMNFIGYTPDDE